jgi:hypothetical protein
VNHPYPGVEQRLASIERRAGWLAGICGFQTLLLIAIWVWATPSRTVEAQDTAHILRVRGLVIEDARGRPRILLGAPFPAVKERVRQDERKTSILFLDEQGHDRLTLGEELEPQINGKVPAGIHRIASGFGVVIHDGEGNERGTYGWLSNGRALITLDRPGAEAWTAMVNDRTGETTMSFDFPPQVAEDKSALEAGTKGAEAFVRFKNKDGKDRATFKTELGGSPSFAVIDDAGRATTVWTQR